MTHTNEMVLDRIRDLYEMLFRHDGYGEMRVEMRILRKGQKEVIVHCGKQYRFVVDRQHELAGHTWTKGGRRQTET